MGCSEVTVRVAKNGFILEYRDDDIEEKNRSTGSPWEDPTQSVVCKSAEEVISVLTPLLPTMVEDDESEAEDYTSAFKQAVKELQ